MKEDKTNHSELFHLASLKLSNEASAEELIILDKLLAENEGNRTLFAELEKVWKDTEKATGITQEEISQEWLRLKSNLSKPKSSAFPWLRIAASILLIMMAGAAFYFVNHQSDEHLMAQGVQVQALYDGSIVTLNDQSELIYPKNFSGDLREVILKGEAFFEIAKNPDKPFIIHTSSFEVGVLGTSFLVRDIAEEKVATVVVSTGSVRIQQGGKSIRLEVGEKGILDKETGRLFKLINDDPNVLSWKTKKFFFDNLPLDKVINLLNNAYGQDIFLTSKEVASCPVTVSFENQSLDAILEVLAATLDLAVKKTSQGIEISGQGC